MSPISFEKRQLALVYAAVFSVFVSVGIATRHPHQKVTSLWGILCIIMTLLPIVFALLNARMHYKYKRKKQV